MKSLLPRCYLPIDPVFTMPGAIFRRGEAGAGALRFETDQELESYRSAMTGQTGFWHTDDDRQSQEARLRDWLCEAVSQDQPGLLPANDLSLAAMAALVQEDIVLMQRPDASAPAARSRAIYMNVNFPGGWCPDCLLGKSFLAIHAGVPVSDGFDGIVRAQVAKSLFSDGDKVRFVWGLAPDDRLDRRLCQQLEQGSPVHRTATSGWPAGTNPWLRVERQVICPLDELTSVFLIRVYRYAWNSLDENSRADIRSAIDSMPVSVRAYKGLEALPTLA